MKNRIIFIIIAVAVITLSMGSASAADLNLTTGSWDTIGLDHNNVNEGPNLFIIQTHVKNNGTTSASNVSGTVTFHSGSSYVNLKTGENTTKNLGNIAPGETKDLYYQIEVTRDANAYGTNRPYTVEVFENGISIGTINGTLRVLPKNNGLIGQNRNEIISISSNNTSPQVGDIFTVTVHAHTSSDNYDYVELPLIQYDPTKIQPISYFVQYGSSTSNSLLITSPGTTEFTSTWTLKALEAGSTPVIPFIVDRANNAENYHYNKDFGEDQLTITVGDKCADLAVTKTDSPDPVVAGNQLTYTVTVTNNGPYTVNQFTLTDTLPVGFTATSFTPNTGTFNNSTGLWTGLNLASGQYVTLIITGTVSPTATGSLTNTVIVTPPAGVTDPNMNNNQASATTTIIRQADLNVVKTRTSGSPVAGGTVSYLITVTNQGPSTINGFTLTDTTNPGLTGATYGTPSTGSYNPATGAWTGLNLASGQFVTITLTGGIPSSATGNLVNTATVAPPAGVTDPDPSDNNSTVTDALSKVADLAVTKTDGQTHVTAGTSTTYTITVTNNGPSTITEFGLTGNLPAGLLNPIIGTPSAGSFNPGTGLWSGLNLATGQSVSITLTGLIDPNYTGATINNTVTVSPPAGVTDPNMTNNQATDINTVLTQSNLIVTKTGTPNPVNAGELLTYAMSITNNGPSTARTVTFKDTLPAALTNTEYSLNNANWYTYASGQEVGFGNLNAGQTVTFWLRGIVNATTQPGSITNTVTAYINGTQNNQTTATNTVINMSPLTVDKSGPATVIAGNTINYTMTVFNNGPSVAHDVKFADTLPAGLMNAEYSRNNANWFAYSSGQLIDLGDINPLTTVTFYLRGIIDPSTTATLLQNVVNVYKGQTLSGNDTANTTVTRQADLAVTKTDSPDPVKTGQTLTYIITVTNNGPSDIISSDVLTVTDTLPAGFTAISWTPSEGTYNAGSWTGLTLDSGQSATLTITGTVDPGITDSLSNNVLVSPPAGVTDPNMNNNQASTTTTVNREADLVITKTVDNSKPMVKDTVHFTMIVNNLGPDTAVNVQVADKLPAGLSFVSYTANYGTYNPATGIWTIGNLPNGAKAEITITSIVENSGTIINEAKVTSDTFDPNLDDNTAMVTINVQQPDEPAKPEVNAGSETVEMQETGLPVGMLVLAILAVLGGLITPKRK